MFLGWADVSFQVEIKDMLNFVAWNWPLLLVLPTNGVFTSKGPQPGGRENWQRRLISRKSKFFIAPIQPLVHQMISGMSWPQPRLWGRSENSWPHRKPERAMPEAKSG